MPCLKKNNNYQLATVPSPSNKKNNLELKQENFYKIPKNLVAICFACNEGPIIGTKFKCYECPNLYLCQKCEPNNHKNHIMFRISEKECLKKPLINESEHIIQKLDKVTKQEILEKIEKKYPIIGDLVQKYIYFIADNDRPGFINYMKDKFKDKSFQPDE